MPISDRRIKHGKKELLAVAAEIVEGASMT
jgi:hypothetical protein